MQEDLERRIERLARDRVRGASALAGDAVGILADAPTDARPELVERLARLRPAMPALEGMVRAAARLADPRELLGQVEAEHARAAVDAAGRIDPAAVVATISNSSLVRRVLLLARPSRVVVSVDGAADEGHDLVRALVSAGLTAAAAGPQVSAADVAVVGCDAIFDDGGFVNRLGTRRMLEAMAPQPTVVVGDRWRRLAGRSPRSWPEPELFEVVPPAPLVFVVF